MTDQRRGRVYIAGPITGSGDVATNAHRAIAVWHALWDAGFAPFCPHLDILLNIVRPLAYEDWLDLDFSWLSVCDALFRMSGASPGADREVAFARGAGIPVFESVEDMMLSGVPRVGNRVVVVRRGRR